MLILIGLPLPAAVGYFLPCLVILAQVLRRAWKVLFPVTPEKSNVGYLCPLDQETKKPMASACLLVTISLSWQHFIWYFSVILF